MNIKTRTLALIVILLSINIANSQYRIIQSAITTGGGHIKSSSYVSENSIGQPVIGKSSSFGYEHRVGFMYQIGSLSQLFAFNYNMIDGWNMVSIPRAVADYRKIILFPTAISDAFIYRGSYQQLDTLQNGIGFWLKYPGNKVVTIQGLYRSADTADVEEGWNLIGSIGYALPIENIIQIPANIIISDYFGYDGAYYSTSAIEPGNAYWIKTKETGKLVLRNITGLITNESKTSASRLADQGFNTLTIQPQTAKNKKDIQQSLFFGKNQNDNMVKDGYELPPRPPVGGFDARFMNNRILNVLPNEVHTPIEFPLSIQGRVGELLKIDWTIRSSGEKYTLIEKMGGKIIAQHSMTGINSITIVPTEDKIFILRIDPIPQQYSLYQNYPNPFNPNTKIMFDLSEHVRVTIKVFDILGREVAVPLDNQEMEEGNYSVEINAADWASGVYFYKLTTQNLKDSKQTYTKALKMILMK